VPVTVSPDGYTTVDSAEARQLVQDEAVSVLDVRTPDEFERLGHIPGARLLPVDLIASAPAVLRKDARPVLVVCEHGVRSVHAARFLARAGVEPVLNLAGGMSRWTGDRTHEAGRMAGPSEWLLHCACWLPRGGNVLDVACGAGRHALLLAAAGFSVHAIDRNAGTIAWLSRTAHRVGLSLDVAVADLEIKGVDLGEATYDAVLVFRYLHRPLFQALVRALRPGGVLVCETFTVGHAPDGKPMNPEFLLQPGELPRLVAPLDVIDSREGRFAGEPLASVAARRA
jgi:rhodanese-related sulfurtransferase